MYYGKEKINLGLALLQTLFLQAQDVEMADVMRENGKIYVVVGVICIIFIGMFAYLIWQDRKLSKLEKEIKG